MIVDPDGYIITNNHVVAGAVRIRVIIAPATVELMTGNTNLHNPQRVYEAKLIGTTRYADLALLKIEEKGLPYIPLPEQFRFRLGQTVIAIGAPEGLDHTVTKGIISAVGRQPEVDRPMVYVQTDAPINPGNSGGPLIDRNGNLVGINTYIVTSGGGNEGLGFCYSGADRALCLQRAQGAWHRFQRDHWRPPADHHSCAGCRPQAAAGLGRYPL